MITKKHLAISEATKEKFKINFLEYNTRKYKKALFEAWTLD